MLSNLLLFTSTSSITLGWSTPVLVENATDDIVTTEGTFVNAFRFGSLTDLTINTVTFTGTNLALPAQPYTDLAFFSAVGTASADLRSLLRSLNYDLPGNIHTITGLTSGRTYMLQWFFADERSGPPDNIQFRNQIVTIAGYSITFPAALVAKATKCYFVATDTTMLLTITGTEDGHIEAYQIRDVTP